MALAEDNSLHTVAERSTLRKLIKLASLLDCKYNLESNQAENECPQLNGSRIKIFCMKISLFRDGSAYDLRSLLNLCEPAKF